MVNWPAVHTVLCDMDGTLLDLRFDNHFWQEHLPVHFARRFNLPLEAVRDRLASQFRAAEGTMNWYCVDHWSAELGVDIVALKAEVAHLIRWRPHAREFLQALRAAGKRLVLVTNAHSKTMALKFSHTELDRWFDAVVCAHDVGFPKEDPRFWDQFARIEPLVLAHTLLIDDSLPVLRAAKAYGVAHTLAILKPDSGRLAKDCGEFSAVASFAEILPGA